MNTTKAVISYLGIPDAELGPIAQLIHDKMTANAATFAAPPLTMAAFQTIIDAYNEKLVAKANRGKNEVLAFRAAREALEGALNALGNYVNMVAKGDAVKVGDSGCLSYEVNRTPDPTPPAAPTNLRLKHGSTSGSIALQCKPDRSRSINEVQSTTGDPNMEANWVNKGNFTGQKGEFSGFTPGTCVWLRVRTIGAKGAWGDWSDPAEIMVV